MNMILDPSERRFHLFTLELIHGSKRVLNTHGRHEGSKRFIRDQVQVFHTFSTRPPRHFWAKDRKRSNPIGFGA
jgi:hypothetical protein